MSHAYRDDLDSFHTEQMRDPEYAAAYVAALVRDGEGVDVQSVECMVTSMTPEMFAEILGNARRVAESARIKADTYALTGTAPKRVAGTGFTRRGGVDAYWLAELQRKADDAERAVRDLENMAPTS